MVALAGVTSKRVTPVRRRRAGWQNSLSRRRLREASASDGGLTVGDTAVVDGHSVGDQDGKTGVFELVGKELEQKLVHEHTARERDGIEAFAITDLARDVGRSVRNGDVKPRASLSAGAPVSIPFRRALMSGWGSKMGESASGVNTPV